MKRYTAVLLIGPTGSGKSPVGQIIEARGWEGKSCVHFDFGHNLRRTVSSAERRSRFSASEIEVIRNALSSKTLIENEHFPIAEKVFHVFAEERGIGPDACIILNGLPRHVGQARDCDRLFDIRRLVHLRCTHEVVYERIRRNSGGDRGGRIDDNPAEIREKLCIFEKRTQPLIEDCVERNIPLHPITVKADTTPSEIYYRITQ